MSAELFLRAREAIGRAGLAEFKKREGDSSAEHYRTLPLLHAPGLYQFSFDTLAAARGIVVDGNSRFPGSLWLGGATDAHDGRDFLGSISTFVLLLQERARIILAQKRDGWVFEPTTNTNGHRVNASTVAMHALFLDCDGRGSPNHLFSVLRHLNFAHVFYQSGGWTPELQKWRIVLPLAAPFIVRGEPERAVWKTFYHHARTAIGACAGLAGEGFDPTVDTPVHPWFLTERRRPEDPLREISWSPGHALDASALMHALPAPLSEKTTTHDAYDCGDRAFIEISDEKREEITGALAEATSNIPPGSNRHELYLALPGALLDRGLSPDEVLAIVEDVSASYPRAHPDKHADNLHGAQTTVAKWERGEKFTRIGELNAHWPRIAQAIDAVLPSAGEMIRQSVIEQVTTPPVANTTAEEFQIKKRRPQSTALSKELRKTVAIMKKSKNQRRKSGAVLLKHMLDGGTFQTKNTKPEEVDAVICEVAEQVGYNAPLETTWQDFLDVAAPSLLAMDFTQDVERVKRAEISFFKGQGAQRKRDAKNLAEKNAKKKKAEDQLKEAQRKSKGRA